MYAEAAMVIGTILLLGWHHFYERRRPLGGPSMFPCADPSMPWTPAGGDYSDMFLYKGQLPEIPKLPPDDECKTFKFICRSLV